MQAVDRMLLQLEVAVLGVLHGSQAKTMAWAVDTLVHGRKSLSVTGLGRDSRTLATTKSNINRSNRLIGNEKIHRQLEKVFAAIAKLIIGNSPAVLIAVDWSHLDDDAYELSASVIHDGRSIPLAHQVHPLSSHGKPAIEHEFLKMLRRAIPEGCRPILLTDAGFRTPWMRAAQALEMDFVCRVTPNVHVRSQEDAEADEAGWRPCSTIAAGAAKKARDLGAVVLAKTNPINTRMVLAPKPGPRKPRIRRRKAQVQSGTLKKARKQARSPWVLVTSLEQASASRIVEFYALRFQCEETFRDHKSHRFGWALRYGRCTTTQRYDMLLTIGMLAALVLHLVGRIAERKGWQRAFQANTVRGRRVLSLVYLAREVLRSHWHRRLSMRMVNAEVRRLRACVGGLAAT